jgi:molybdopterin/thiamine biosynthesis adenylyltransferase
MNVMLVGAGGTGCWIAVALHKEGHFLAVCDGDVVEERNLDRQLFEDVDVGSFKAEALCSRLSWGCLPFNDYVNKSNFPELDHDVVVCAADNHRARYECLRIADTLRIPCVLCGNEQFSFSAYPYFPKWKGTDKDPRIYYPVIAESAKGKDPAHSCQIPGEQSAHANLLSAALATFLVQQIARGDLGADALAFRYIGSRRRIVEAKLQGGDE